MSAPLMTGIAGARAEDRPGVEAAASAVAWPAIIGGAFAAAALTLILLALGAGFGLASVSPQPGTGASATTFTVAAAVWLIVVQWLASGTGGYITGRMRTKWVGLHTHEVLFRDTANGLLTWAVATVIGAAFLASAASAVMGRTAAVAGNITSGAVAGASQGAAAQGATQGGSSAGPTAYFVDQLYRSDHPAGNAPAADARAETTRILVTGLRNGGVSTPDRAYLAQLVATRTGLSPADADKRVGTVLTEAKAAAAKLREAANTARKATARLAIVTGLSMLIGAFIACVAAALGGRQRDEHQEA
ncbi:MAG: hypothetical protein ACREFY_12500 [Acetobacteraceae bacterium]